MQTDPCTPEKFVEDVILFTVAVDEAGPDDVDSDSWILLAQRKSSLLKLFENQIFWQGNTLCEFIFSEGGIVGLSRRLTP